MPRPRIRRAAVLLALTAVLVGCGTEPAQVPDTAAVPGNAPVSAPAAGVAIAPMAGSKPVGLAIPALGLDSGPLLDLGLDPAGALEVPPDAKDIGWFDLSPTPGSLGPAIIAAHVDYKGVLGPFHELHTLKPGDEVRVRRADGSTAVFETYQVQRYPKASFPTAQVYGDTTDAEVRLITCGGAFDHSTGNYLDNIVAFARLVGTA